MREEAPVGTVNLSLLKQGALLMSVPELCLSPHLGSLSLALSPALTAMKALEQLR